MPEWRREMLTNKALEYRAVAQYKERRAKLEALAKKGRDSSSTSNEGDEDEGFKNFPPDNSDVEDEEDDCFDCRKWAPITTSGICDRLVKWRKVSRIFSYFITFDSCFSPRSRLGRRGGGYTHLWTDQRRHRWFRGRHHHRPQRLECQLRGAGQTICGEESGDRFGRDEKGVFFINFVSFYRRTILFWSQNHKSR